MNLPHPMPRMIAFIFLACALFGTTDLSAQQKFTVSLTGGASFPAGRFGDQVNTLPTGLSTVDGGATTGWNGTLQLGTALTPRTWIMLTAGLSVFKRAPQSFEDQLEMIYGNTTEAQPGSWKVGKILAGPSFRLPLGRKLTIRPSVAAGIAKTNIPALTYTTYNQGGNPLITLTREKIKLPAAFAYQFGMGCGYNLGTRLRVVADANFFAARANYEYYPVTPGPSGPNKINYEYPLNNFSLSAGVELSF